MFSSSSSSGSSARTFFKGQTLFVTGATGFLGQALIHKLLSLDSPPEAIYVLVREKRGVDSATRVEKLLQGDIFEKLWKGDEARKKDLQGRIRCVVGDITEPGLGLSQESRAQLASEVSVVFHSAATVKFDDALTRAVAMNVEGSRAMLQLAKEMRHLRSYVHVSTAYCHCHRTVDQTIEERFYPVGGEYNADQVAELCRQEGAEERLNDPIRTREIVGERPNTYTFTKALAEQMVEREKGNLPLSIIRPSIVVAAKQEPAPGWITNLNGPTGLIAGAGTGLLRTLHCYRDNVADLIPVDTVINLMCTVAATPPSSHGPSDKVPIYNCTSGLQNPIIWSEIENWALDYIRQHPMQDLFWYPCGTFKKSRYIDMLCQVFFHFLPAYLLDMVLRLIGRKAMFVTLYRKMTKAIGAMQFFALREWRWDDSNVRDLWERADEADRVVFDFDVTQINWKEFLEDYVLGTRLYVLKNSPDTLPQSRRKLKIFHALHLGLKSVGVASAGVATYYLFGGMGQIAAMLQF